VSIEPPRDAARAEARGEGAGGPRLLGRLHGASGGGQYAGELGVQLRALAG
jgi:hypothetical protein